MDKRRNETNARVANTDVGRTYQQQHGVVRRIADEFGLNRKQRLAFLLFGAAWIGRNETSTGDALRLHVSGGAGSGKSYVLKAIKALIDCPGLKGVIPPGRVLTLAFQGKQAACVGGNTVHSATDVPRTDKGGVLDNTNGQSLLSDTKAALWKNVAVLAIEEVSMVSRQLMGCIQKATASVRPSAASLPYAGMICVTFGDLNQVRHFASSHYRCMRYPKLRSPFSCLFVIHLSYLPTKLHPTAAVFRVSAISFRLFQRSPLHTQRQIQGSSTTLPTPSV